MPEDSKLNSCLLLRIESYEIITDKVINRLNEIEFKAEELKD